MPDSSFMPIVITGAIITVVVLAAIIAWLYSKELVQSTNYKFKQMTGQLDRLYSMTDQLSQSCDFLDDKKHAQLALDLASFFAKMTTLEKAHQEAETLMKSHWRSPADQALDKCLRYTKILNEKAEELVSDVNDATGGVKSFEPDTSIDEPEKHPLSLSPPVREKILAAVQPRFRKPSWMNTEEYSHVHTVPDNGLADIGMYLRQHYPVFETMIEEDKS